MSVYKPTHGSQPADRPRRGSSSRRRTALELAHIYVSSSAFTSALEVLDGIPSTGWDEEARLLRAECLIGLGRMLEAQKLLGRPSLPTGRSSDDRCSVQGARRRTTGDGVLAPANEAGTETDRVRLQLPRYGDGVRQRRLTRRERVAHWRFHLQMRVLHRTGQYREVLQFVRAFVHGKRVSPNHSYFPRIAGVMAQSMLMLRRPAEARECYEQVYELYRAQGSREGLADTLLGIANTHMLDCHWDQADAVYQECRYRYEELGHASKALAALINLGVLRVKRGDFGSGRSLLLQALSRASQAGEIGRSTTIHLGLAMVEIRTGVFPSARRHLVRAIRLSRQTHNRRGVALALEFLGEMYLAEGNLPRARRCLQLGISRACQLSPTSDILFEIQRRLAEIEVAEGNLESAREFALASQRGAQAFGDAYETAAGDRVLAQIEEARHEFQSALGYLRRSAESLDRLGETYERARTELVRLELEHRLGRQSHLVVRERLNAIKRTHEETPESLIFVQARKLESCISDHAPVFQEPTLDSDSRRTDEETDATALSDADREKARAVGLVSDGPEFNRMLSLARRVAPHSTPILVLGEPGTGRGLLARLIHSWSRRRGIYAPFHCANLPGELLTSELFGPEGGDTDEVGGLVSAARNGTLYLDDIAHLPVDAQAALIQWMERREVPHRGTRPDVRFISAARPQSVRSPYRSSGSGEDLREELFSRVARVVLELPPLRERLEDLPVLVDSFLTQAAHRMGIDKPEFPPDMLEQFRYRAWPGNLIELRQEVELFLLRHRRRLEAWRIQDGTVISTLQSSTSEFPPRAVQGTLRDNGWNLAATARALGVSRSALYRFLKRHGIERPVC